MLTDNIPKLKEAKKGACDQALSIKECGKALNEMENNKSPRCDGFTVEFYKFFWDKIKIFLHNSFVWSFQHKLLSIEKLKKGKDLRLLKDWRPITLLNVDYKILTKALAMRMQGVLDNIVDHDQVGYIKGRFIGLNIYTTANILTFCQKTLQKGLIAQIDFQKAFDTVDWSFLLKFLKFF